LTPPIAGHYGSHARAFPGRERLPPSLAERATHGTDDSPSRRYLTMAFALSAEREQKFAEILSRYPNKMAACIPVLHLCQEANQNWVSEDVIDFVARRLDLSPAHVKGRSGFAAR
jgi:hypothetical protein